MQAHCQSPTRQRCNQCFVKELAKPAQEKNFKIFLPPLKEKIKTLQLKDYTDKEGINVIIDIFNMRVQFDSNTRSDKKTASA